MNTVRPAVLTRSVALLLALPMAQLSAADWLGTTSSDWNVGSNWTGGVVPQGQNAYIGIAGNPDSAPFTAWITADVPQVVDILVARTGGPGVLNHSAGSAMTGLANWVDVGTEGGNGTYNLANPNATGGILTGMGMGSGSVYAGGNNGGDGRMYIGGVDFSGLGGTGLMRVNTSGVVKIDNDLTIGTGNGTGVMLVDAGTITTGGWNFIGKPDNGAGAANGTLKMSGGSLTNGGGRTYVGLGNSTGRIELSGTGVYNNIGDWFAVGQENLANPTPASIDLSGASALNTSLLSVGGSPDQPGRGTLTISGNANLNVNGELWIGNRGTSNGQMVVNGGTVSVGNWFAVGRDSATGVLTINGGLVQKTNTNGSFEITNANSATASGTVNLNGGTLAVNDITGSGAAGSTANLFLNGGVLKPTVDNGNFISGNVVPLIKNGGAVVDTDGKSITVGKVLASDAGSTGGLTKTGQGTLALGATTTYAGSTVVNGGTLQLNVGSQAGTIGGDGPIIVNNGGTLASGAVDALGYFNPTANNALTLNAGGTLRVLEGGRLSMDRKLISIGGTVASTGVNFDNNQSYAFRREGEAGELNSYNFTSSPTGVPSTISAAKVGVDNATFNVTRGSGTADLVVTGSIVNSFGSGGLVKEGDGIMVVESTDNTYTGPTTVKAGTLLVNGSLVSSPLRLDGGKIGGTGTLGAFTLSGGTLDPGSSTGILNVGSSDLQSGMLRIELNGDNTPGLDYDQVNVTGTVALNGAIELAILLGYSPTIGDMFTILANDDVDPIVVNALMTFGGSPIQDNVDFGASGPIAYQLDYNAGSNNNDLVLKVVPEPGSAVSLLTGASLLLGLRRRRKE